MKLKILAQTLLSLRAPYLRTLLLPLLLLAVWSAEPGVAGAEAPDTGPLLIERQGSFFIGGREITSPTLSPAKFSVGAGTITVDQVYARYQIPIMADSRPNVVLVHGCCLTGKTWETTPDGRLGWDEYFVRRGFPTYVIDQAWRGRSASNLSSVNAVRDGLQPPAALISEFSPSHEAAWVLFRFGPKYGEVFPGERFPVTAAAELWKQMVPDLTPSLPTPNPTVSALSELAKRIGPSILIGHSQSGIYPFQTLALDRKNIVGVIAIEPADCPSATGDMAPYKSVPTLVLFGDNIAASPTWAPILKSCRDFVSALRLAGGSSNIIVLPERGIKGNSHMLMQDSNNIQIADILIDWISKIKIIH